MALVRLPAGRPHLRGFIVKLLITSALVTWLVRSGSLDFGRLAVLVNRPTVLFWTCTAWLTLAVILGTLRWRQLLLALDVRLSWTRALALHTTGLFFNAIVPGNVGGDLLKNRTVLGNQPAQLLTLALAERVLGLVSLIWLGTLGLAFNLARVLSTARLYPLLFALGGLFLGTLLAPVLLSWGLRRFAPQTQSWAAREGLGGLAARSVGSAARVLDVLRVSRKRLLSALLLSLLIQSGNISYFAFLTRELGNVEAPLSLLAMLFPLGALSLALPISVSGLGVGHLVFEELFLLTGMSGGANTFNVYIVAQMAPSLIGALTFLFSRQRHTLQQTSGRNAETER